MATKHLKELLNEDQEPFVLKNYIDEKLQKSFSTPKSSLQIKKRKPISDKSSFSHNFCKNACFFSSSCSTTTAYSPDVKKSPLFEFRSPLKSPCRNSNTLFVHIPARTAALLLEAALRIQKNNNSVSKKTTKSRKNGGFGLFGSFLKRIAYRKRTPKNESIETEKRVSVKDIIRWNSSNSVNFFTEERREKEELVMGFEDKVISEMGLSCFCNSRRSSVWSESNEEKSFDLDTSSSRSEDSEDMEFVHQQTNDVDFGSCENGFCSSPFRFVLHNNNNTLSPCRGSPEFNTLIQSPSRNKVVEDENKSLNNVGNTYDEEDKEQNSPVSVLDPPFEDDDDQEDEEADKDHFKLESNFANVQRAKQQLLHKLRRFERLAELDPLELEKKIAEEEDEDIEGEEQYDDNTHLDDGKVDSAFVRKLLTQSNMYTHQKIPSDMNRLVLDLVAEERGDTSDPCSKEIVVEKVCKRLESWKEVDYNTIDMMVDFDFRRDTNEWMKNPQEMQETAVDIEFNILGFLMEEISEELVQCRAFRLDIDKYLFV